MYNKVSNKGKQFVKYDMKTKIWFVKPSQHHVNAAEHSIEVLKNYSIVNSTMVE